MHGTLTETAVATIFLAASLTTAAAYTPGPIPGVSPQPSTSATKVADRDLGVAGVDIANAGTSKQSRMTYLNSLLQETQGSVWARCGEILGGADASVDTVAFCKDVMPR